MIKTTDNLIFEFVKAYSQPYHHLSLLEKKDET